MLSPEQRCTCVRLRSLGAAHEADCPFASERIVPGAFAAPSPVGETRLGELVARVREAATEWVRATHSGNYAKAGTGRAAFGEALDALAASLPSGDGERRQVSFERFERLWGALTFYADEAHYERTADALPAKIMWDAGKVARDALDASDPAPSSGETPEARCDSCNGKGFLDIGGGPEPEPHTTKDCYSCLGSGRKLSADEQRILDAIVSGEIERWLDAIPVRDDEDPVYKAIEADDPDEVRRLLHARLASAESAEPDARPIDWPSLILKADRASDRERSLATLANMAQKAQREAPASAEPDERAAADVGRDILAMPVADYNRLVRARDRLSAAVEPELLRDLRGWIDDRRSQGCPPDDVDELLDRLGEWLDDWSVASAVPVGIDEPIDTPQHAVPVDGGELKEVLLSDFLVWIDEQEGEPTQDRAEAAQLIVREFLAARLSSTEGSGDRG